MDAVSNASTIPMVVIASRNLAKQTEVARLVGGLAIPRAWPKDISLQPESECGGQADPLYSIQEGIARWKAEQASRALSAHAPDLADALVVTTDGGLLIPALGTDWEPARTRRFTGDAPSNVDRAEVLLAMTAHLIGEQRQVGWREAMAVAHRGEVLASWMAESPPGLLATGFHDSTLPVDDFWVPALWICPDFCRRRLNTLSPVERAEWGDHWSRLGTSLRAFLLERAPRARR